MPREGLAPPFDWVSRETIDALERFTSLVVKWNEKINLVSNGSVDEIWNRHVRDSLQLVPFAGGTQRWLDIGSGGGFPGLVLAIALNNQTEVHLIESNKKKSAFLQNVVGQLGLRAVVHAERIETIRATLPLEFDVVSARAVASLTDLLCLCERWLAVGARGIFPKGKGYQQEIENCDDAWLFDLIEHPSLTESQSVILELRNVRRRSS